MDFTLNSSRSHSCLHHKETSNWAAAPYLSEGVQSQLYSLMHVHLTVFLEDLIFEIVSSSSFLCQRRLSSDWEEGHEIERFGCRHIKGTRPTKAVKGWFIFTLWLITPPRPPSVFTSLLIVCSLNWHAGFVHQDQTWSRPRDQPGRHTLELHESQPTFKEQEVGRLPDPECRRILNKKKKNTSITTDQNWPDLLWIPNIKLGLIGCTFVKTGVRSCDTCTSMPSSNRPQDLSQS